MRSNCLVSLHGAVIRLPPPFMASIAEVKVDKQTGKVIPLHFYSCVDCGTVINPKLARVQVEGGVVQAIGWLYMKMYAIPTMVVWKQIIL